MNEPRATVELEARGPARIVRIVRPERRNALDRATLRALGRVARQVARDPAARALVLTGTEPAFAAGGDLRELARVRSAAGARSVAREGRDAIDALRAAGVPLIAAINGDAHGGACELAAACDYRIIEAHARFHWVQGRFAVTTAWGGTARLLELVGPGVAARWLLTAASVSAHEALHAGLVDEVVDRGEALARACALAEQIAAVPRATTRRQLALLRGAASVWREAARAEELRAFAQSWISREHQDAVERFMNRRRGN